MCGDENTKPESENTPELEKHRVQAYVAEYQAMVAGINLFMSLQFSGLLPLTGLITAYKSGMDFRTYVFVVAIVFQISFLLYYFSLHEVYNRVLYVEIVLKPNIAEFIKLPADKFWAWERHLKNNGKVNSPSWGDWSPAILSALALLVVTYLTVCEGILFPWGLAAPIFAFALMAGAVEMAKNVEEVRKKFEKAVGL